MVKAYINNILNGIELEFNNRPDQKTLEQLKANNFKWNRKTSRWYKKQSEETKKFLFDCFNISEYEEIAKEEKKESKKQNTTKNENQKILKEVLKEQLIDAWGTDNKMIDYCLKKSNYIVELESHHIISIEKPSIKKSFCFGYGMNGISDTEEERAADNMAHHARTNINYFIEENLADLNEQIKNLTEILESDYKKAFYYINYYKSSPSNKLVNYTYSYYYSKQEELENNNNYFEMTKTDIKNLISGLKIVKEQFVKRLEIYLKKYGLSNINTWTYLVD